jgi:starch-binding outer membrane protein, SusD/RagB family
MQVKMRIFSQIKRIITGITMVIAVTSCHEWLELIPPDGLVKDEYWTSKEDIEAVLMGAYQRFAQMDERLFLYGELRADMLEEGGNTPGYQRLIMDGNIYPDNVLCDWEDFYLVIHNCNSVLKYAPLILEIDQTFTPYQKDGFEAEAYFLRSLAYFYLVRIFKDVPLVLEASEEDDVNFYLSKSEDTVILSQIKADLELASGKVTDNYGTLEQDKGRANRGAILALMADISLWSFEYQEVIRYVNLIEDLEYLLSPSGKWFENYYPGNSFENIFEFQFNNSLGQSNDLYSYTYFNNRYYLASSKALKLLSPETSREITRGRGSLRSYDAAIWKYIGAAPDGKTVRPSSQRSDANWIVYRYADVQLMKAEALSQIGRYAEALDKINEIRNRAQVTPISIPNSPESFENAILNERALELAFEGKRWFDLMRMGRRNNFSRKSDLIAIVVEKIPSSQRLVLASKLTDPYGWYIPIAEDELERNSALKQNPYYAAYSSD